MRRISEESNDNVLLVNDILGVAGTQEKPKAGFFNRIRNKALIALGLVGTLNAAGCEGDEGEVMTDPMEEVESTGENWEETTTGGEEDTLETSTGGGSDDDTTGTTSDQPDTDSSTGDTDSDTGTTGEPLDCMDFCMAENTAECQMNEQGGDIQVVCKCEEGYDGNCDVCAEGYQNVGENGQLDCKDVTPPPIPDIGTNNGGTYFFEGKILDFYGSCVGDEVYEVYYQRGTESDFQEGTYEELKDLDYDGKMDEEKNKWGRIFQVPDDLIDVMIIYRVILKDKSGNSSQAEMMAKRKL